MSLHTVISTLRVRVVRSGQAGKALMVMGIGHPLFFFAGGADDDSVAAVTLVEGRERFRFEGRGADIATRLSFVAGV
jgi:hypothetical protein